MSTYITEQEQIETIKQWFKENGMTLAVSLLVAALAFYGFRHWQFVRARAGEHASVRYEQLLTSVVRNDGVKILQQADYLIQRYPHSTYAKLAELLLARAELSHGNFEAGEKYLQRVMDTANVPALRQIARIRLARVLLAQNKAELALALLRAQDDKNYLGAIAEVRGDAYAALGNNSQAHAAYLQAIQALPEFGATRSLLQMKLDNLGAASP